MPGLDDLLRDSSVIGDEFKFDLAAYLAKQPNAPVKSLGEILDRGLHHAELDATFRLRNAPEKRETEHYRQAMIKRRALRAAVLATLEEQRIDALAYPTLRRKPALIGEAQGGTNCQLSATTGLPAISMPAGFSTDGLPIALELLGGAWEEAKLLKYAYAWEQATKPRRPPFSTPPLVKGVAPAPITLEMTITGSRRGRPRYRQRRSSLHLRPHDWRTSVTRRRPPSIATTDRVLGLTIQRSDGDKPGPIVVTPSGAESDRRHGTLVTARPQSRGLRRRQTVSALLHARSDAARQSGRQRDHAASESAELWNRSNALPALFDPARSIHSKLRVITAFSCCGS